MLKISNIVRTIIAQNEEALVALNDGYLNMSAYGEKIKKEVEKQTKKAVKLGTIVAALNRLKGKIQTSVPSRSKLKIEDLAVKTGLSELTYENTSAITSKAKQLLSEGKIDNEGILFICQGIREVSFFVFEKNRKTIEDNFKKVKPKFVKNDRVSLTVR